MGGGEEEFNEYLGLLKTRLDNVTRTDSKTVFEILVVNDVTSQIIQENEIDSSSSNYNNLLANITLNNSQLLSNYLGETTLCSSHALLYNIGKYLFILIRI